MIEFYSLEPQQTFFFESFLSNELGLDLYKKRVTSTPGQENVCKYYLVGKCHRGTQCSFVHPKEMKTVVCKHYLRGLCSKGDRCEFLHEYNLKKMPECWFYTKYGECSNPECLYLHIDPDSKIKACGKIFHGSF